MAMILELQSRAVEPDVTVVQLIGRMSIGNTLISAEDKMKKLVADGAGKLVLDLSELTYVDSAAIGVLVMIMGIIGKKGGRMRLAAANPVVAKILEITQLHRIIPTDKTVDDALQAIAG